MPMRPLVSAPIPPEDDTLARISGIFAGADPSNDPGYMGVLGQLQGMLGDVESRPGPQLESVPGRPSPLAAMAAAFAGGLAEHLGQRGASQTAREGIVAAEQAGPQASARNMQATRLDQAQRQRDRLDIMLKIGEVKANQAKEAGDLLALEKQIKANFTVSERLKKYDLEIEGAKATNRVALERVKGEERRATNADRIKLEHLASGGNAEAKVILSEANDKADAATRRSEAMRRANAAAFGAEIFPETEIRIQEAKEQLEIDRIYKEAFEKTQGVSPKTEKTTVTATSKDLDSFFTP